MTLKEKLLETFSSNDVEKQNPWQPYRGPGGGEGWMNAVTGEVRYQDNRPEPSEGMPDDHEGGLPAGYDDEAAEQYEEAEEIDDWLEPDLEDWVDEIDGVTEIEAEVDGETIVGNPMAVDEESGTIEVIDDETFEEYHVTPDQIETHPLQLEPDMGWGDGWTEPPAEPSDLETGQEVELYDLERDEWVTAEVRQIDDWGADGMYVDIYDEETGEVYEFVGGEPGSATDAVITAQEDLFRPDTIEDFDHRETDFEAGEEIVLFDEPTGEFYEGEVDHIDDFEMVVETDEGSEFKVTPDNRFTPLSEEGVAEYELSQHDMLEAPELTPDDPLELAEFDGSFAQIEHPAEGPVVGEVSVVDHSEQGRHLYVGESEVGIPLDDTEHPLSQVEVESLENPYNDFNEEFIPFLESGDELILSDGENYWTSEVDGFSSDGSEIKLDGGWMDVDELAEGYDGAEVVMTDSDLEPSPPEGLEWEEPEGHQDLIVGDEIWFDTVDTGVPTTAEIASVSAGLSGDLGRVEAVDPETGEEYEVSVENIEGHAPTSGGIPEPEAHADYYHPGDGVKLTYRDVSGNLVETTGMLISEPGMNGQFGIRTEDGDVRQFDNSNSGETFAITDDGVDVGSGGSDRPPEEVASDVAESVGLETAGAQLLDQGQKDRLKGELMYHYDADRVQEFYNLQSGGNSAWKSTSGSQEAADYEAAYMDALGIEAPGRGEVMENLNEGYAPRQLREIAETAAELSRKHFEETFGDGYTLSRGTSPAAAHNLFGQYLAAPAAEQYDSPLLAINNFSVSRHTAERFEGDGSDPGAVIDWETSPDDVVAMHDYLFTEEGTHESEEEITLRGDMDGIPAGSVELNASGVSEGANFGKLPEEWNRDEAKSFEAFTDKAGADLASAMNWSEDIVHNALEIREVLEEEHKVDTATNEFFSRAETAAEELGVNHGAAGGSDLEYDDGFEEFDPYEWDEADLVGEKIRYEDSWGEEHEGEVYDADAGGYIETEIGHEISPMDITEIQSGQPTTAEDFDPPDFDAEALEGGDFVQWVGHDGIESGEVSYTGDGGDFVYVEDDSPGGVATVNADKIFDVPEHVAETADSVTASDLDVGTSVTVNGEEGSVAAIHQDFGADGEDLYAIEDENGVIIDEYYPEEIPDHIDSVADDDSLVDEEPSDGPDVDEWGTDLGTYVTDTAVTGATPGDKFTVTDEFVGDEMELEVVDVNEDGVPVVDPVDQEEHGWSAVPIDQHPDWTINSVQEGEASDTGMVDFDPEADADALAEGMEATVQIGNGYYTGPITDIDEDGNVDIDADSVNSEVPAMIEEVVEYEEGAAEQSAAEGSADPEPEPEPEHPDPDEFAAIDAESAADLNEYEGEWVQLELGNFEDPVVGRLESAQDVGPSGTTEVTDIESLGDSEFPMNSYSGTINEVTAVHDDSTDFNDEIDDIMGDVGLGGSEGSDEPEGIHISPESVHDAQVGVGEEFVTNVPGEGEVKVEAMDVSVDPNAPMEVQAVEDGEQYLIWPGGDVENV